MSDPIACGIYCVATANWKSLAILAAIGGATMLVFVLIGLMQGLIGLAATNKRLFSK